jgi:hypothetical protein
MRSSTEEALSLLKKWRDEESWVLVTGHFDHRVEQHMFWATYSEASDTDLLLSGDFAIMRVPLGSDKPSDFSWNARFLPRWNAPSSCRSQLARATAGEVRKIRIDSITR